ncbi:MAG: hypothetical protein QOJ89_524 [bacterium]|jgi:hypothetical protein
MSLLNPYVSRRGGAVAAGWLAAIALLAGGAPAAIAAAPIDLGAAGSFAVLGATTVTSAGVSTLSGDLGVSPGTAVTGFGLGAGTFTGSLYTGDDAAAAHADLGTAYAVAEARSPAVPAGVLDGLRLGPGVYASGAALTLAGTLTLDAGDDPGAVFILQAGSTLTTAADSHVMLAGGAQACNVFWQVGSSATLGAGSDLKGSVLAYTSITVGADVGIDGRALARGAAVTLDNDTIGVAECDHSLSHTAPVIEPFEATLTGVTQTVHAAVGAWSVYDARAGGAGYRVTVTASAPQVGGSTAAAGTGGSLTLTPRTPTAMASNTGSTAPAAAAAQLLSTTAATISSAAAGTGQGGWRFAADSAEAGSLAIVIPGDAGAGAYSSTLTFTTAPPA